MKPDIQARAAAVMEQVNSEAWQRQKNQFLAAIKNQHGIPEEEQSKTPSTRARPLLFISSSMPEITLRNYARDLEKVKGVMV
ncbi:conjugal transfer protein TrbC, partial [Pantoea sp. SIMBA_133]